MSTISAGRVVGLNTRRTLREVPRATYQVPHWPGLRAILFSTSKVVEPGCRTVSRQSLFIPRGVWFERCNFSLLVLLFRGMVHHRVLIDLILGLDSAE